MKRYYIALLWLLLSAIQLSAQCYQKIYAKALGEFQAGNYVQAAKTWGAAKGCPDKPANNDLEARIRQANERVAAKTKKEEKPAVTPPRPKHAPPKPKESANFAEVSDFTETVNGVSFVMKGIQGGTFQMGSNDGNGDEKPVHSVTVSSFYIGKYEVTQAQWRAVMGSDPAELYFKGCDNCPVEGVSWNDIQQFLSKLYSLTGKRYRLPTEAEWEYAARGGNSSRGYKYSGSNDVDAVAWNIGNSGGKTHPVGTKQANELGIYDMSGNVWEWCSDWYGSYSSAAVSNPTGAATGSDRVNRGGSWDNYPGLCRAAFRYGFTPSFRLSHLGFRLLCSVPSGR